MYPPAPNQKNQKRSMFQAEEPEARTARAARSPASECFQEQADKALSGSAGKAHFGKQAAESSSDGLPSLTLVSGSKITTEQAGTASGSAEAIKGLNADTDQVKQMMSVNATPELFQELKDQDRDQAADLAVSDTNFQRQALHDTGDTAFADKIRARIGTDSV